MWFSGFVSCYHPRTSLMCVWVSAVTFWPCHPPAMPQCHKVLHHECLFMWQKRPMGPGWQSALRQVDLWSLSWGALWDWTSWMSTSRRWIQKTDSSRNSILNIAVSKSCHWNTFRIIKLCFIYCGCIFHPPAVAATLMSPRIKALLRLSSTKIGFPTRCVALEAQVGCIWSFTVSLVMSC